MTVSAIRAAGLGDLALLVELMTEFYAESNLALPPELATAAGPGCSRSRVKWQGIWC